MPSKVSMRDKKRRLDVIEPMQEELDRLRALEKAVRRYKASHDFWGNAPTDLNQELDRSAMFGALMLLDDWRREQQRKGQP